MPQFSLQSEQVQNDANLLGLTVELRALASMLVGALVQGWRWWSLTWDPQIIATEHLREDLGLVHGSAGKETKVCISLRKLS